MSSFRKEMEQELQKRKWKNQGFQAIDGLETQKKKKWIGDFRKEKEERFYIKKVLVIPGKGHIRDSRKEKEQQFQIKNNQDVDI